MIYMPSEAQVRAYLIAHDLHAVSRQTLERLCDLDDCHIWDARDRLHVIVRKNPPQRTDHA